jgi:hypothetical protein
MKTMTAMKTGRCIKYHLAFCPGKGLGAADHCIRRIFHSNKAYFRPRHTPDLIRKEGGNFLKIYHGPILAIINHIKRETNFTLCKLEPYR